jgi:hypothetical protein
MKTYDVFNTETGYSKVFYSLSEAKKAMKANNAAGFITKVTARGDWMPCGEIKLNGSNKTFVANSKQTMAGY